MTLYDLDQELWKQWLLKRPKIIQKMATEHPPNILYPLDGHKAVIHTYNQQGTITMKFPEEHNTTKLPNKTIKPEELC